MQLRANRQYRQKMTVLEMKESEGHYIVKINRSDKDKVNDLLEQQNKLVI